MRPQAGLELEQERGISRDAALQPHVDLGHPAFDSVGVELGIPWGVQGVGDVRPPSVATDFYHLWATVERFVRVRGVRAPANDPAELHAAAEDWVERVGDVVLPELT